MLKKLSLLLALTLPVFAAPECNFTFTLDATHTVVQFNNQTHSCYFWAVNYFTSGFTAISLTYESAPNGINSSTPGTFTAFSGFPVSATGDNAQAAIGLNAWTRIRLASFSGTGTITGIIQGVPLGGTNTTVQGTAGSSTGPPLPIRVDLLGSILPSGSNFAATPTGNSLTQYTPKVNDGAGGVASFNQSFPYAYNGSTMDLQYVCPLSAPITYSSASGIVQLVGLTASQIIRVCHISLSSDTATNIKFLYGTGSNCGTGGTDITGLYNGVKTLALDFGPGAALRTIASNAFCISSSASATLGGVVSYAKF